jgi:hypothetical protein
MRGRLLVAAIAGTVAFGIVLGRNQHERALATAAYLDFACAVLLLAFVALVGSAAVPVGRHLGRKRRTPRASEQRPHQLEWVELQLAGARTLRPLVAQIASAALERSHGLVLEREPSRARAMVGDRIWALIDPDVERSDPPASDLDPDELGGLLSELEAIT